MPGIDMSGTGGLEVASNLVHETNQLTSRSSDAFGDMSMMGVLRLRGSPAAARLKEQFGIDLSTPIGVMRAQARAAELAARGYPEAQQSMQDSLRQFMPDDDNRAMALVLGRGMDPEAAYQVTRPQVRSLTTAARDARRGQGLTDTKIDAAAADQTNRPDVGEFYQGNVRREAQMLEAGTDISEPVGRIIVEGLNDLNEKVIRLLSDFLNSPGPAIAQSLPVPIGYGEAGNLPP